MPNPLPLHEAVASIQVPPGFKVELAAAEPLVRDPINLDWGPDGKLWVVEMGDYPLGIGPDKKPGGRIRYLEDLDGDGYFEKSTVFLEGLRHPTDVKAWRKGVLVTSAPDILYAEDTDGDGICDSVNSLYTGFKEGNSQHLVNTLSFGLDNWIHMANGDSNGQIRSLKSGKTVDISGRDLKIKPDTGDIETLTGRTQYGRCRDDWGNWFGCNNSKPNFHFALSDLYLRRNPFVIYPQGVVLVPEIPYAPPIFRISKVESRYNNAGADHLITGACGLNIYRDIILGPEFYGNTFVSESVHNLVHRQVMRPMGTTFSSSRAATEQTSEFLASTDTWFRPTVSRTGPDGALWVVDMHRYVIEHPEWIPEEWLAVLDVRAGSDLGRIYRVVPGESPVRSIPHLNSLSTRGLVQVLTSPNGIQRDMAQQWIIERNNPGAVPELEKLLQNQASELGRLHALCTLDGLGKLRPEILADALKDTSPEIRRHAVRISESFVESSPWLLDVLIPLVKDSYPPLLQQLAYTLGEWSQTRAGMALAELVLLHGTDPYLLASALSSAVPHLENLLASQSETGTSPSPTFESDLMAIALGIEHEPALIKLLRSAFQPDTPGQRQFERVAQLLRALEVRNSSLKELAQKSSPELRELLQTCASVIASAPEILSDGKRPIQERIGAIAVFGKDARGNLNGLDRLSALLLPETPIELQMAAVNRLGEINHSKAETIIVEKWSQFGPTLRSAVLNLMINHTRLTRVLLDSIESGLIPAPAVDVAHRDRLFKSPFPAVRNRAEEVFGGMANQNRQAVLDSYETAFELQGDPEQGHLWFTSFCAVCHQVKGTGRPVGPDLAALTDNSLKALLTGIILPNQAVEDKYQLYDLRLKDGTAMMGMVQDETGNSVTLVGLDGNEHIILRSEIESMSSTGRSQMPEGLEAVLNPQQMADIHAFISQ
jgi:putative membrane-bound dehydrogenase-like protein